MEWPIAVDYDRPAMMGGHAEIEVKPQAQRQYCKNSTPFIRKDVAEKRR